MARAMLAVIFVLGVGGIAPAAGAEHQRASFPLLADGRLEAPAAVRVGSAARLEQNVLALINWQRARRGLAPLRVNSQLEVAARTHSKAMAQHGFFGHESNDGAAFARRMKSFYPLLLGRSWAVAENLVWGSPDLSAQESLGSWLRSSEHRRNLLGAEWREVGVGAVHALAAPGVYLGLDVTIVTVDFGVR
jgi:uncharacterized protein YkwD